MNTAVLVNIENLLNFRIVETSKTKLGFPYRSSAELKDNTDISTVPCITPRSEESIHHLRRSVAYGGR